jgi:ribosome-associated heat shock protein Hsp15
MSPGSRPQDEASDGIDGQRLDKWLWFARVAKTRTLSAALVSEGKVRINAVRIDKLAHTVRVGDTITIVMRQQMRILKVAGFAQRRGSAEVAARLFHDLTPAPQKPSEVAETALSQAAPDGLRAVGSGRPTKQQRREMDRFKFRST